MNPSVLPLVSLDCPGCEGVLEGENNSLLFFCPRCGAGLDVTASPPRVLQPLCLPRPADWGREEVVRDQPFWFFPRSRDPRAPGIWVGAVRIRHQSQYGDLGLFLTRKAWRLPAGVPFTPGRGILPADRGLERARTLALADPSLNGEEPGGEAVLVRVPCLLTPRGWKDALLGWITPAGVLI